MQCCVRDQRCHGTLDATGLSPQWTAVSCPCLLAAARVLPHPHAPLLCLQPVFCRPRAARGGQLRGNLCPLPCATLLNRSWRRLTRSSRPRPPPVPYKSFVRSKARPARNDNGTCWLSTSLEHAATATARVVGPVLFAVTSRRPRLVVSLDDPCEVQEETGLGSGGNI